MYPLFKWSSDVSDYVNGLTSIIPKNKIYCELSVGNGSLLPYINSKIFILSDPNDDILNVYRTIRSNPMSLLRNLDYLYNTHDKESYYKILHMDRDGSLDGLSNSKRSARFLYLVNNANRGVFRYTNKGYLTMPYGDFKTPRKVSKSNILDWHRFLNSKVLILDYNTCLNAVLNMPKGKLLIYDSRVESNCLILIKFKSFNYIQSYFNGNSTNEIKRIKPEKLRKKDLIVSASF